MLSGETASGKYPVEAVQTMARIAEQAEKDKSPLNDIDPMEEGKIDQKLFLAHAAIEATKKLGVAGIITDGETGQTARSPLPPPALHKASKTASTWATSTPCATGAMSSPAT